MDTLRLQFELVLADSTWLSVPPDRGKLRACPRGGGGPPQGCDPLLLRRLTGLSALSNLEEAFRRPSDTRRRF
jgi:hypothetical protein